MIQRAIDDRGWFLNRGSYAVALCANRGWLHSPHDNNTFSKTMMFYPTNKTELQAVIDGLLIGDVDSTKTAIAILLQMSQSLAQTLPDSTAIAALCLESLLDVQGLLELGFDTNIQAVIAQEFSPIEGLDQTLRSLAQLRAHLTGRTIQEVLNDVYPTALFDESDEADCPPDSASSDHPS